MCWFLKKQRDEEARFANQAPSVLVGNDDLDLNTLHRGFHQINAEVIKFSALAKKINLQLD